MDPYSLVGARGEVWIGGYRFPPGERFEEEDAPSQENNEFFT